MKSSSRTSGSSWKGGTSTYGVRVNRIFMRDFVSPGKEIILHLEGWPDPVCLQYKPSIHNKCPEFRGASFKKWFSELGLLDWEYRKPHKFIVKALEKGNHFSIRRA